MFYPFFKQYTELNAANVIRVSTDIIFQCFCLALSFPQINKLGLTVRN